MQLPFSTWMHYVCTLKKPNRLHLTIHPRPHPKFTLATLSLENSGESKSKKYQIITVWKVCVKFWSIFLDALIKKEIVKYDNFIFTFC